MDFFDFHHHTFQNTNGIYNLNFGDEVPKNWFSAGIHPHFLEDRLGERWAWLQEMSTHPKCFAIGECGLDGMVKSSTKLQAEVFEKHILLANQLRKPLIIHCVRRHSQLLGFRKKAGVPMIIHGFNKRESIAHDLMKHDFYLSFGNSLLQNVNLQQVLQNFPLDRMFLETDSKEVEIGDLYRKVSTLKGLAIDTLTAQVAENLKAIENQTD